MVSTCKKCGGTKEESDAICDYCHKAQEDPSTNQVLGRKAAIMPCKKCGGNKAESDAICDYCHKAQGDPNINQAEMLKLRNGVRPYPRPRKKYKQLIINKVLDKR
jgi:DnaJ-class molecular chaperone